MPGSNHGSFTVSNQSVNLGSPMSNFELLKRLDLVVLALVFVLLLAFSIHNFDSIGQDIGRHLKIGEIIWQTKTIPQTNLFSFTEPDFPFLNHHWLSEVIFYKVYSWFGFAGLIWMKVFLILSAFLFLFSVIKKWAKFWPILVSFLLSIFVFIHRTEVRPEIFSFVILSFFLFVLFREKYSPHQGRTSANWKILLILALTGLATLINPAGIYGALAPFNILEQYGYSIVENQTLSFLSVFNGLRWTIFVFKLAVGVLTASFLLTIKKIRQRIFEVLISVFFIYAGFKMLRNLPLYALGSFPVLSLILTDINNWIIKKQQSYPPARLSLAEK